MDHFRKLSQTAETNSESCQTSMMDLLINLKNVMRVFVYFGKSIAKTDVFIDISHIVAQKNRLCSSIRVYPIRCLSAD